MSSRRRGLENISIITNVDNFETLLEQYFVYHSNFFWDKAKEFLENERDKLKARHPSCGTSIIVGLFNSLYQLNLAEKNYMQLQFFSQKFLQRKDIVKLEYSSLKFDFQQLEQRGTPVIPKSVAVAATQTSPIHYQTAASLQPSSTPTKGSLTSTFCSTVLPKTPVSSVETSPINHVQDSEEAQDVLNCTIEELSQPGQTTGSTGSPSTPTPIVQEGYITPSKPQPSPLPQSSSSSGSGFFSKLFRFSSRSSNSASTTLKTLPESDNEYHQPLDSVNSQCQDTHFELESIEKFAAHVAGQLVNYVSMRIDMIQWFETLLDICSNSFCLVDGCIQTLRKIQHSAEQNFHHPVLSPLKIMFYFECDILLGLLNLHTTIQNYKYLESLFYLQDAHNKLNLIATLRDQMLAQISGNSAVNTSGSNVTGNAFQDKLRRNITSSSLASSINSSSGMNSTSILQIPSIQQSGIGGNSISGVPSPSGMSNSTTFIYPFQSTGIFIQPKFSQRNNSFATMPPLFQWLNRLKQFLLSKYSFYFHSILLNHLGTGSNGPNVQDIMKPLLSKQAYDFHHRNVNFLKKFDNTQLVLLYDTHERECNLSGYCSPYTTLPQPQGVSSIPVIYCHPGEFSMSRLPSLIMIMDDKTQELNSSNQVIIIDCDKQRHPSVSGNNGLPQTLQNATTLSSSHHHLTYFLFRPDPDFTFAIISEGHRRPERDILQIIQFLQETCTLLKGTKIFTNLKTSAK